MKTLKTLMWLIFAVAGIPALAQEPLYFGKPLPRLTNTWIGGNTRPMPTPSPTPPPLPQVKAAEAKIPVKNPEEVKNPRYKQEWLMTVMQFESYPLATGKITESIVHPDALRKDIDEVGYGVTRDEVNEAKRFGLLPPNATLPKRMTKEEADLWFMNVTIPTYEKFVEEIVSVPLTCEQKFALISFCHNLGCDNLTKLTSQDGRLNDSNYEVIAELMNLYVNAGQHKNVAGLIKRRAWESELWRKGTRQQNLVSR